MSIINSHFGCTFSIFLKILSCCFVSKPMVLKAVTKSECFILFFLLFNVSAKSSSSSGFTKDVATRS